MPNSHLLNTYSPYDQRFTRGDGVFLFDREDRRYLDFGCGISVTNFGHNNSYINSKINAQLSLIHTSNLFRNDIVENLADRIVDHSINGRVFFCNSGAEANEGIIKLLRLYNNTVYNGKRPRIITMKDSFHGRTVATLSATGQSKIQNGFEPILKDFEYIEFNNIEAINEEISKGGVSGVILELIQGESGVHEASKEYVRELRKITEEHNVILAIDEVQSAFGRTGKLFAFQHYGIKPDAVTVAKAMANGLPMGAFIIGEKYCNLFTKGSHGSTFGGNLLAAAACHGVLDLLLEDGFLENVENLGLYTINQLKASLSGLGIKVRGLGYMIGIDFNGVLDGGVVVKKALELGLVMIPAAYNTVRFYPPLNADKDIIDSGINILKDVVKLLVDSKIN